MHDEPDQGHLPLRTGEVEGAGPPVQDRGVRGVARQGRAPLASERPALASPDWARRVAEPGERAPGRGQDWGFQPRSEPNLDVSLDCCRRYPLPLATRLLGAGLA